MGEGVWDDSEGFHLWPAVDGGDIHWKKKHRSSRAMWQIEQMCLNLLLPQASLKWQWRNEKGINPQPQRVWERGKNQMRDVNQTVEHRWRRGSLFSRVEKATVYRKASQQETSLLMLQNLSKVQQLETPGTWEIQSEGRGKMRTSPWKSNIMSS